MEIAKAIAFVDDRGSGLEKARLHCILNGSESPREISQGLFSLQNEDGGFPFDRISGNLSTINDTTVALWWLDELDLLSSEVANRAFAYLLNVQRIDGRWDEDPCLMQYDLPPWSQPGNLHAQLYLSAYALFWLAQGAKIPATAFRKGLDFLVRNQDETGRFPGYMHTTWIGTAVFLIAGKRYSALYKQGLNTLASWPLAEWEASQLAWALDCLSQAGLSKDTDFTRICLNELSSRQKSDGSWASEDGEAFAVGATIQAIKVFKRYGLLAAAMHP